MAQAARDDGRSRSRRRSRSCDRRQRSKERRRSRSKNRRPSETAERKQKEKEPVAETAKVGGEQENVIDSTNDNMMTGQPRAPSQSQSGDTRAPSGQPPGAIK